jgi:ABC-2 type transport system permease protein
MALGALLASVLYGTVFVTLSVLTGRALVIGLGYLLLWEGFVTSVLPGTQVLSIREYAMAVTNAVAGIDPARPGTGVDPLVAVAAAAVVLVGAVLLGVWRLGRFEVSEAG